MARKPKLISAPTARGGGGGNTWQQMKGTMFAYSPDDGPIGPMPDGVQTQTFETPDDINYERMITERERELGLPMMMAPAVGGAAHQASILPDRIAYSQAVPVPVVYDVPAADLTSLPAKFELVIERVNESWKITSPLHVGLWRAGTDLPAVIEEALGALAMMISVDGPKPKGRRR